MITNTLISFASLVVGSLGFLFVYWRNLKEDYRSNEIFTSGLMIVTAILIGIFVSSRLLPSWWFWTAFIGAFAGFIAAIVRIKPNVYELADAWVLGLCWWMTIFAIFWFFTDPTRDSFLFFIMSVASVWFFVELGINYKKFTWYRAPKVGFAGLGTIVIFLLLRAFVSIPAWNMVFFPGRVEIVISGLTALACLLLLLRRHRKR